jgi:hypothetical protein
MMKKAKLRLLTRAARNRAVVFAGTCRAATVRESVPEAFFSSLLGPPLRSNLNAESGQDFAPPKTCDVQGSAVEFLQHPFSFQRDFQ